MDGWMERWAGGHTLGSPTGFPGEQCAGRGIYTNVWWGLGKSRAAHHVRLLLNRTVRAMSVSRKGRELIEEALHQAEVSCSWANQ